MQIEVKCSKNYFKLGASGNNVEKEPLKATSETEKTCIKFLQKIKCKPFCLSFFSLETFLNTFTRFH